MECRIPRALLVVLGAAAAPIAAGAGSAPSEPAPARLDFNRDVRPILSENCFLCHGPDAGTREAGLRLDSFEGATADLDGVQAVVPGDLEASELVYRITAEEDYERMPPPESGKSLTPEQILTLQRWVEQGAEYSRHWSFVPPERGAPPAVREAAWSGAGSWARNPIDSFLLAGLLDAGLVPQPEADRETLVRRVTLDLTGLPPTIEEIDRFLADDRPGAYERLVDELLDSHAYAENQARYWLDAARYGDTHGFHLDNERALWRWRDWVIRAFHENKPFDEFTVEQLAGDLLPDPSFDQLLATGFNRCNPTTGEGGLIEEEYLAKYAMDRVDTFGTVFLGLTIACAQCHDHKFDPVSQKEYYQLFAYFHSLAEEGTDRNALTPPPSMKAPYPEQQVRLAQLAAERDRLQADLDAPMPEVDAAQAEWEAETSARLAGTWHVLEPVELSAFHGTELTVLDDASVLAGGENPATETYEVVYTTELDSVRAILLEALAHESHPNGGVGRASNSNIVLTGVEVDVAPLTDPEAWQAVELAGAVADHSQKDWPVAATTDALPGTGWAILPEATQDHLALFTPKTAIGVDGGGEGGLRLRVRLKHDSVHVQHNLGRFRLSVTDAPEFALVTPGTWYRSQAYAGGNRREAVDTVWAPENGVDLEAVDEEGAPIWTALPDAKDDTANPLQGDNTATYLFRTFESPQARVVRAAFGSDDAIKVWLNGESVHVNDVARAITVGADKVELPLRAGRNELLMKIVNFGGGYAWSFGIEEEEPGGVPLVLMRALGVPADERDDAQRLAVRTHFRERFSPAWAAARKEFETAEAAFTEFDSKLPVTMIWRDLDEPRPTYFLKRGEYDQKGDEVAPGTPAALPPLPADAPKNRLALAEWVVDPEHPLTARVAVNRFWLQHFGNGLVDTPQDFGSQGSWPTHPELLDWLAVQFVESGWDVKALHRLIVTSAAYRQSAALDEQRLAVDPANCLVSRGPRLRLEAEAIRDLALAVSGLLVDRVGGPSVRPYQPGGLWKAVAYPSSNTANFQRDQGEALYRRSMYTFWKRTSPPPSMTAFDAPNREFCTVDRARTNTPLQALVLLNDIQFVEAARKLAERIHDEGGSTDAERAVHAFRMVVARHPSETELPIVLELLTGQRAHYAADPAAAEAVLTMGEAPVESSAPAAELAAWTQVAALLLNLDETVTRG